MICVGWNFSKSVSVTSRLLERWEYLDGSGIFKKFQTASSLTYFNTYFLQKNAGFFLVFKANKSKEDLNVACRNFGLFDRHLNLGGPVDTNLPLPGFLVSVKAFYDNNFLSHFGEESELRYAFTFSEFCILFTWSNNQFWN